MPHQLLLLLAGLLRLLMCTQRGKGYATLRTTATMLHGWTSDFTWSHYQVRVCLVILCLAMLLTPL
jgi:hypothetical protein